MTATKPVTHRGRQRPVRRLSAVRSRVSDMNLPLSTTTTATPGPIASFIRFVFFGGGVTLLLTYLRTRFIGFPLSPAAYVLDVTWAMELFWLDITIAWFIKTMFLRYGGIKLYRTALPFFLGLILGDFVTGAAWNLFGALTGLSLFRTFAN